MKRKYRWAYLGVAGCIIIVNVLFIFIKAKSKNSLYEKYEWAEEFYGEKLYLEIDHKSTSEEKLIGKQIAKQIEIVLSYMGNSEDAKEVGELKYFYWFNQGSEKPVSQKSKVTHLTTIITKNTGHVWLSYTVTRYGREGEIINHTGDGPVLLYIEKINNEWVVVDKDEPA
ncbi:hypothetical protein HMPREF1216_00512 [Coprococcus sp. HPP0048]|nr:hypothetical protein HMPREF1216_00512 [Coprococcus sp. HPP0048]